jgi:glycine cleavage system aminomethyltransferase T
LERSGETAPRKKVTLVFDPDEVKDVFGADHDFILSYARYRVETGSGLAGMTYYTAYIDPAGTILSLALVNKETAEPGTKVTVVWGEHPGRDAPADVDLGFARINATVQVAPYDDYARTSYRQD